jgi:hypothetical protein
MGWLMGGVSDRYLRFADAGDQHVGRTVCGLDPSCADFALLPPHFLLNNNQEVGALVNDTIIRTFPSLKDRPHMRPVLALCLASLVHSFDDLKAILHAQHAARSSFLFCNESQVRLLKEHVYVGHSSPELTATGVPTSVAVLRQNEELQRRVDAAADRILAGVERIIEEKAVNPQTITRDCLMRTLREVILEAGVAGTASSSASESASSTASQYTYFQWGGRFRTVPEGFALPSVDVRTSWRLWFEGDPTRQILPFRNINPQDLSKKERKKYSDWKCLLEMFISAAENKCADLLQRLQLQDFSVLEVVYQQVSDALQMPDTTTAGRKRRRSQVHVKHALEIVRKRAKLA